MKHSCRHFCVLAIVAVLATSTATSAEPSTQPATASTKPILIVWAHTEIPEQGAPTLDVVDLERYFVTQLADRGVQNVVTSATTKIPNPPAPNMYLIEVSVDTMRLGKRSTWNRQTNRYDDHDIFEVDLALTVNHPQTGVVVGTTGERHEQWFTSYSEDDRLVEKRAAIFKAVDNLADRFVTEWANGKYGGALPATQAPDFIERAPWWHLLSLLAVILLAAALTLFGLSAVLRMLVDFVTGPTRQRRELEALRVSLQRAEREQHDKELMHAFALDLKTDNFSHEACRAAAAANLEKILADHSPIETQRAKRILDPNRLEAHYWKVALHAMAVNSALDESRVIETLRQADEWEFRVLQEAKRLVAEAPK